MNNNFKVDSKREYVFSDGTMFQVDMTNADSPQIRVSVINVDAAFAGQLAVGDSYIINFTKIDGAVVV
jgi:hypothetical protein